jgi:hypothetical protein
VIPASERKQGRLASLCSRQGANPCWCGISRRRHVQLRSCGGSSGEAGAVGLVGAVLAARGEVGGGGGRLEMGEPRGPWPQQRQAAEQGARGAPGSRRWMSSPRA